MTIIKDKLITLRGQIGMLDRDIADLFDMETRIFNQSIKRHQKSFSEIDTFILEKDEFYGLRSQFVIFNSDKKLPKYLPIFFTKSGIEKLSLIFKKESVIAIQKDILKEIELSENNGLFPNSELKNNVLTYTSNDGSLRFDVKIEDETVWLTQHQMAELFGKNTRTISEHINNIFDENELQKQATIRNFRIVQIENNRKVNREITYYNLDVIISVGYRVKSLRGTEFRQWSTRVLKQYLVQGYAIKETATEKQLRSAVSRIEKLELDQQKLLNQLPLTESIMNNVDLFQLLMQSKKTQKKVSGSRLIILCEGKTDIVYIQTAIRLFEPNIDQKTIQFVDAEGSKNLEKMYMTYQKQEGGITIMQPCLFVFDSDVSGIKIETKDNIIRYIFSKQDVNSGYIYQRGIENNFHESVFLRLFENDARYIDLIKRVSNTDEGKKETLINVEILKGSLCEALAKEGRKEDFNHFRGIVSLISELVNEKMTVEK
jgi:hypothetical protein